MADAGPGKAAGCDGAPEVRAAGFDQILDRLKVVVEKLEAGNLGLEEALTVFEEGVALTRRGGALLDAAERRVEMLTRGPDGGERVVDFNPGSPGHPGEGEGGVR
jgi:exodeoxyribonuclease VII small subunit